MQARRLKTPFAGRGVSCRPASGSVTKARIAPLRLRSAIAVRNLLHTQARARRVVPADHPGALAPLSRVGACRRAFATPAAFPTSACSATGGCTIGLSCTTCRCCRGASSSSSACWLSDPPVLLVHSLRVCSRLVQQPGGSDRSSGHLEAQHPVGRLWVSVEFKLPGSRQLPQQPF